jgi:hypothetical protein
MSESTTIRMYTRLCKLQKGCTRLAAASDKVTSCFPMVGGSIRVLRLLPPLKLVAMIITYHVIISGPVPVTDSLKILVFSKYKNNEVSKIKMINLGSITMDDIHHNLRLRNNR